MKLKNQYFCFWASCALLVFCTPAFGDIEGFDGLNNWTYNQADAAGTPSTFDDDSVTLTNGDDQLRSIWFNTPQSVSSFSASFRYQVGGGGFSSNAGGLTFVLHNDPRSLAAVTDSIFGFGYDGIEDSVGVTLELNGLNGSSSTGFYRNGVLGTGSADTSPHSPGGNGYEVQIDYDGFSLSVEFDNGIDDPFLRNYIVSPSIESSAGSDFAYVGFGASSSTNVTQRISDFTFRSTSAVPEPSTTTVLAFICAVAAVMRRRMQAA